MSPSRPPLTLRLATFNFLGGGSARRSAHWSMLREQVRPDLLLTQESRPPPADAGSSATALWTEASRGWGTGLYAPKLVVKPVAVEGFAGWVTGGRLASARLSRRPLWVFSIHCPFGKRGYLQTIHEILDRLQAMAGKSDLILGGDFNVAAGLRGPDDLVKMSKPERAVLTRLLDEFKLIPCWQTAHPGRPLAQTLRWAGNRATPYHCDGIFIPRSWKDRLVSCEVISGPGWEALSDHNPVLAVLGLLSR